MNGINQIPTNILFSGSYVLALHIEPYILELRMDFFLTPEHPRYAIPSTGEHGCYVRGRLVVSNFRKIEWLATGIRPGPDATGEIDYGTLDDLSQVGDAWKLEGDFGAITVDGDLTVALDD